MIQTKTTFTVNSPATIVYGKDAFEEVGVYAKKLGSKALIVSDPIMDGLGFVNQCKALLTANGLEAVSYLGVTTEPVDTYVAQGLSILQTEQCDLIISVGGGSCIDTAKAIAVVATNGGYIGDYMKLAKIAEQSPIPHIAVPTTAGTGSEATDATVITNTTNDVKMMIKQPAFMPPIAIVDPMLTVTSPPAITAATGIDALSHAIESYLSRLAHPYSNVLALSAMDLIIHNILKVYEQGDDIDAREAMSLGSMQAGLSFSNASVALVHGMSRPIGALFHVPHGISNAMLLPAVLEFTKDACVERLADIGKFFNAKGQYSTQEELATLAIDSIKELCKKMNIGNLQQWGIEEDAFYAAIPKMAIDAMASGSPANNPKVPTQDELMELYKVAYHYEF
ncbi:iron-containing alcohol dehydrogenase [Lysinibacillus sphaericus]|uniref:Alcohol dehydrogenase n=3 Tax=Lysinibacillus TaxID=400634 RepID=A0A2S0K4C5_LYSSH|nr:MULTISPECIES: iron-containing alcohol dehydrogenase [Lysinibacillus]AHN20707.1 alcohol dehydrogenase [Lysinibacillus varians]AVK98223.1 alcohol dehydrogenase [Lysinibacillus sphaericus]MCS1383038.1 iron-containing alcohol dehydrogenase [Lysinibacillus sphaericus]MED4543730.1 iron-containing alcohol dehydrogenase [Lysinibacillus sphaericus]TKI19220.1 iron-containing alcohol dehydrogenase [Lysinibacillus sphaericus]